MSEMKVGDVGVLQNMGRYRKAYMNGLIAEVVSPIRLYPYEDITTSEVGNRICYRCIVSPDPFPDGRYWSIDKDQIRPLSNPDADQITETEEEAHV